MRNRTLWYSIIGLVIIIAIATFMREKQAVFKQKDPVTIGFYTDKYRIIVDTDSGTLIRLLSDLTDQK